MSAEPEASAVTELRELRKTAYESIAPRLSPNIRKALAAGFLAHTAYKMGKKWYDERLAGQRYVIAVPAEDNIYAMIQEWLLGELPPGGRRRVSARTSRNRNTGGSDSDCQPVSGHEGTTVRKTQGHLRFLYDGSTQWVTIGGHRVEVEVERPDWNSMMSKWRGEGDFVPPSKYDTVKFTAQDKAGIDAVASMLRGFTQDYYNEKHDPDVWVALPWGSWSKRPDLPTRRLETVILGGGDKEKITDDLQSFLDDEEQYAQLGIPWHRGYLLHGPPGTGKSSLAKALANHFDLDIYYVPLGDLREDISLISLVSEVSPRSMLLLEDIDAFQVARSKNEEAFGGVSLSGLLNTLDGVTTPHGLIVVMTTNHPELLDEALRRKGRNDFELEVAHMTTKQLSGIFEMFYGVDVLMYEMPECEGRDLSPAAVMDVFKTNLDNPAGALEILTGMVVRDG